MDNENRDDYINEPYDILDDPVMLEEILKFNVNDEDGSEGINNE